MTAIAYNIGQALGITIMHSLWQGLVIYMVLRVVLAAAPQLSPVKKYNLSVLASAAVCLWFVYTLWAQLRAASWSVPPVLNTPSALAVLPVDGHVQPSIYQHLSAYLPYITMVYFIGLTASALRLSWEWHKIRLVKRSLIPAEQMQQFINSFSKKLGLTQKIQLNFSSMIDVPCVIGYLKPIILLPVSLSTHLSACEVESILLHELSHIKRNDYLANLLQQAVTVILFFNPFTWLINRIVNEERENSCDDLVIQKTGKRLIYANALLKLEQSRYRNLQLALSLTGNKFHLLNRIERIMKTQKQAGNIRHTLLGLLLLVGSLAGLAWFNPASAKRSNAKSNLKAGVVSLKGDSLNSNGTIDTGKHSHLVAKSKIIHKKAVHHTVKMVRRSSDSSWGDSLADYYHSPEWKAQMAAIRKQSEEIKKHFNSPEWKAQVLAMQKQGEDIRKQFDSPEWKKQMQDIKEQGEQMKKQFDSPEWKKQMADIKKQGEEIKKQFDSPEWKKQMEDIKKQGDEMKKQFDNPEWKKQMEDIRKQGEEMKKQFDSPEWKKQMEDIKKQGKEMKKQFDSPEWKKQVKELKKYKGEKWILKDSVGGVGIYKPAEKDTVN